MMCVSVFDNPGVTLSLQIALYNHRFQILASKYCTRLENMGATEQLRNLTVIV